MLKITIIYVYICCWKKVFYAIYIDDKYLEISIEINELLIN